MIGTIYVYKFHDGTFIKTFMLPLDDKDVKTLEKEHGVCMVTTRRVLTR